jgi:four helix bundle protein
MSSKSVMPKQPVYKNLEVYQLSKKLVVACYELTHDLRREEAANFVHYIRTAALSAHVNIAQAVFSMSDKKKKPLKAAISAIIIIDAAVDILVEVGFATSDQVETVIYLSNAVIEMLDGV